MAVVVQNTSATPLTKGSIERGVQLEFWLSATPVWGGEIQLDAFGLEIFITCSCFHIYHIFIWFNSFNSYGFRPKIQLAIFCSLCSSSSYIHSLYQDIYSSGRNVHGQEIPLVIIINTHQAVGPRYCNLGSHVYHNYIYNLNFLNWSDPWVWQLDGSKE